MRVLLGILGVFAVILLLAGCGDGSEDEAFTSKPTHTSPTHTSYGNPPSTTADLDRRAVYDKAAEVLQDASLSYSDRRNRLRLVRRSFGDDLFFAVIQDVPVYDAGTGQTVTFTGYMADLAGTFVGHPQAPITFDPTGAATQIYFSPTEDTVRRMTGIGVTDKRVREYNAQYRGEGLDTQQAQAVAKAVAAPPPAFVSRDPELNESYERAKKILTNSSETEESRREKIRILQQDVGQETMTLLLRYVPIIDLEKGNVQTFDDYMRDIASSYPTGSDSPIERDPVGAAMSLLFDPSADNIAAMTGIGLSGQERREASEKYESEQVDVVKAANQIVADTASQYNWEEVHQDVQKAAEDLDRDINRASEDINRAVEDTVSGIITILGGD